MAVVHLPERREDQHRCAIALLAQHADQRQTVALRQHPIDDKNVVISIIGQCESLLAIAGEIGDIADLAECFTR